MKYSLSLFLAFFVFLAIITNAKKITADECKVCIDVIEGVEKTVTEEDKKDLEKIENRIEKYCKQKNIGAEQKKVCYHLDPIKREASRPISFSMPAEDVCIRKLNKKNPEFCSVKYGGEKSTEAEKTEVDVNKMRISQLKAYLAERGLKCTGCYEKSDYVKRVKEAMNAEL